MSPHTLVLSTAAFLAAGVITAGLLGPNNLSLIAAIVAAYLTYRHFHTNDTAQLTRRLAGHDRTFPVPYPVAYGCIKDALARCKICLPGGTPTAWHIIKDDDREGTIIATFTLQESYSSIGNTFTVPSSITASFNIRPQGDSTRLTWSYFAYCPFSPLRIHQSIDLLDQSLHSILTQRQSTNPVS